MVERRKRTEVGVFISEEDIRRASDLLRAVVRGDFSEVSLE